MMRAVALALLVALLPTATRAEDFQCPSSGRLTAPRAPSDFPVQPDARCVVGGLLYFVGPDGEPYKQMTSVPPGWYFTASGYEQADALFQRRGAERDTAEARAAAVSAACAQQPGTCATEPPSGVGVRGVLIAVGVGLALGAAAGAYLTARALR